MFHWCVISGVVSSGLALDCDRENHARISFQLAIQLIGRPLGSVEVFCSGSLAPLAVKYLRQGDRGAVDGFLSMREWQSEAGELHKEACLIAFDLELIKGDGYTQG
jgi:hypothetical protein